MIYHTHSCHDGDTCRFIDSRHKVINVRFDAIDAPEVAPYGGQPGGQQATAYLRATLPGKVIRLACHGSAKGKRKACAVYANGQDVQAAMVSRGLAWDYPQYSKGRYRWQQRLAMVMRRGIWTGWPFRLPQPPWQWRKQRRARHG